MTWIILWLVVCLTGVKTQPTACTEDSHCAEGLFCDSGSYICQKCLRCEELKRESLLPPNDCVKSIVSCGSCMKGLVSSSIPDGISGTCSPTGGGGEAAFLPAHGWAAVAAASLMLILVILLMYFRNKSFKVIAYSSRTSLQSTRVTGPAPDAPPPPYNVLRPPHQSRQGSNSVDVMETNGFIRSSQAEAKLSPPVATDYSREVEGSQAAIVYNNPAYVRLPQNVSRCSTPEAPLAVENTSDIMDIREIGREQSTEANNDYKAIAPQDRNEENCNTSAIVPFQQKNLNLAGEQATRPTNMPSTTSGGSSRAGAGAATFAASLLNGPSFVINVVENINNTQQCNDVTF